MRYCDELMLLDSSGNILVSDDMSPNVVCASVVRICCIVGRIVASKMFLSARCANAVPRSHMTNGGSDGGAFISFRNQAIGEVCVISSLTDFRALANASAFAFSNHLLAACDPSRPYCDLIRSRDLSRRACFAFSFLDQNPASLCVEFCIVLYASMYCFLKSVVIDATFSRAIFPDCEHDVSHGNHLAQL
jgi:hypothetical protein